MKKILLTIVFMITTFVSNAQSDSLKGSYYSLKGKIINKIQLTPPCGVIAWGTVIELEILEFTDSSYHDKEIAVIFTCPEFYKENFLQVGQTYALKLSDKNPANFGWTIPNLDILKSYKTSYWPWVIDAQKTK